MNKVLRVYVLVFGIFMIGAQSAHAADAGLTVEPVFQEVVVPALGGGVDSHVMLRNDTQSDLTLRLSAMDFDTLSEQAGIAFLGLDSTSLDQKYRLATWMRLEKDRIVLAPGAEEKVKVRIENNDALAPGGHYGALVATVGEPDNGSGDGVSFKHALSSLFFVRKTGGERYDLAALDVSSDATWYRLPRNVSMRFRNGGNVHAVPRGILKLSDMGGTILAEQPINQDSALLLPERIRTLTSTLKTGSGWRLPGLYTIELSYRIDGQDAFAKVSVTSFYVGSPTFILGLLGVLLAIYLLVLRIRHARHSSPTPTHHSRNRRP